MTYQRTNLSERVRPVVEAAPWVIGEIHKLEQQYDDLKEKLIASDKRNELLVERLNLIIDMADNSNDCQYGTLSANYIKEFAFNALIDAYIIR